MTRARGEAAAAHAVSAASVRPDPSAGGVQKAGSPSQRRWTENERYAAGGWSSDDLYKRELADVNGDHMADIVGFASSGVYGSQSHAFP
jgi:hypothetical protein